MSNEISNLSFVLLIAMLFFWLIYRIARKILGIIRNKIIDELPYIRDHFDSLQHKIDAASSRIEFLERKVGELENKIQPEKRI